jgi:LytS/YehU family sensor histidine kinase
MLILVIGLSTAIRLSQRWQKLQEAKKEAERIRSDAELKNLRNQLNPHFLLNTLNNIYALIAFDPEKAQVAVGELSKLLRHALYDNQKHFVPLYKEVEFIENYIDLMKMRVTNNVKINTNIDIDEDDSTPIAPLIFISLIENAFKHGISQAGEGEIDITITNKDDQIMCEIVNTNYPKRDNDKSGSGIGLEQVARRLELMYAGRYNWEKGLDTTTNKYFSKIVLNNDNKVRDNR